MRGLVSLPTSATIVERVRVSERVCAVPCLNNVSLAHLDATFFHSIFLSLVLCSHFSAQGGMAG